MVHRMRPLQRLLGILDAIVRTLLIALVVGVIALAAGGYLAFTGKNLQVLRGVVTRVGTLTAGQRTASLSIKAELMPNEGRLEANTKLTVSSIDQPGRRFFFLLSPDLAVDAIQVSGADGSVMPARLSRLWALLTVELEQPVAANEAITLVIRYSGMPPAGLLGSGGSAVRERSVLLGPESLWYPADGQSFFRADVSVTAPTHLSIVNNGSRQTEIERGNLRETRWTYDRPIPGLSLVAGHFHALTTQADAVAYRVYVDDELDLDMNRTLSEMIASNRFLSGVFGDSAFSQITLLVSPQLRRAINDGTSLIATGAHYFRNGDLAASLIAHEIAHNWWGATVSERWLTPGTGGEWLVEGFATFASWLAMEAEYGPAALRRNIARDLFDPDRQGPVSEMSVLENGLTEGRARDTIYRKGGYVALMLRNLLGSEPYLTALRDFLAQHRFSQVSDHDLQTALEQATGQDLSGYFSDWVRSDKLADLTFDKAADGSLLLTNIGRATIAGDIELLKIEATGEMTRTQAKVGDRVELPADGGEIIIDPELRWADVQRQNNRYPARSDVVAATARANHMWLVEGAAEPWVRATVSLHSNGQKQHTWEFNRGLVYPPTLSVDGERAVVSYSNPQELLPQLVELGADGSRRTLGHGDSPRFAPDGAIFFARNAELLAISAQGAERRIALRKGWQIGSPRPAPDGNLIAYTAARQSQLELRLLDLATGRERRLLTGDRDRLWIEWSPDSRTLYVGLGVNATWRIIALPVDDAPPQILADGIVLLNGMGLSPSGDQLAFSAVADPTYPLLRSRLYVLDLRDQKVVDTIEFPSSNVEQFAWQDDDHILAVATAIKAGIEETLPATRRLQRVEVSNQQISDVL